MDAWARLSADHGVLGLDAVLAPAIDLAAQGYAVSPRVACDWQELADHIGRTAPGRSHWLLRGKAPMAGDIMSIPALAKALRCIAERGRDGFYKGEVAEDMVRSLTANGGVHTLDDFDATACAYVDPIATRYKGYDVLELPPNGQGVTALFMLNILSALDAKASEPLGADRLHLDLEVQKLAYTVRDAYVCDPDFAKPPLDQILSNAFARRMAAQIDPAQANDQVPPGITDLDRETVYISVVDGERNAVSFINSIYSGFGSGWVSQDHGIVFHNRGAGFVLKADHPNCVAGGKRPKHTIIPALLMESAPNTHDRVVMPFGVMGGDYQPMGHVHVLRNMLDFGMDVQQALDAPRIFYDGRNVLYEKGIDASEVEDLARRGHKMVPASSPLGGGQAIWIDGQTGALAAGSDPRKDGCALAF